MSHEITWRRVTCSEIGLMLTTLEPAAKAVATRQTAHNDLKNSFYIFYILYMGNCCFGYFLAFSHSTMEETNPILSSSAYSEVWL